VNAGETYWDVLPDYVECTECGHPIESHDRKGCLELGAGACNCPEGFTTEQIRAIRKQEGKPAKY